MNIYSESAQLRHLAFTIECRIRSYSTIVDTDAFHSACAKVLQRASHEIELLSFDVMQHLLKSEAEGDEPDSKDLGQLSALLRAIEKTKELQAGYFATRQNTARIQNISSIEDALCVEQSLLEMEKTKDDAFELWAKADEHLATLESPILELTESDIQFLKRASDLAVADTEGQKILFPIRELLQEEKRELREKYSYDEEQQQEYRRKRLAVLDMLASIPRSSDRSFVAHLLTVYERGAARLSTTFRRDVDFKTVLDEEDAFLDSVIEVSTSALENALNFQWGDTRHPCEGPDSQQSFKRDYTKTIIARATSRFKSKKCSFRFDVGDEIRVKGWKRENGTMEGIDPYGNAGTFPGNRVKALHTDYMSPLSDDVFANLLTKIKSSPVTDKVIQDEFDESFSFAGRVLDWRVCAWSKNILLQGKFYICDTCVGFFSYFNDKTVFGSPTIVVIPWADVIRLEKASNVWIPNSIEIFTAETSYFFASFMEREATYNLLTFIHRLSKIPQPKTKATPEPQDMPPHLNGKVIDCGLFSARSSALLDTLFLDMAKDGFLWQYFVTRKIEMRSWPPWSTDKLKRTIEFELPVIGSIGMSFSGVCKCTESWEITRGQEGFVVEISTTMSGVPFSDIMHIEYHYRAIDTDQGTKLSVEVEVFWTGSCMFKSFIESRIYSDFRQVITTEFCPQATAALLRARAGATPLRCRVSNSPPSSENDNNKTSSDRHSIVGGSAVSTSNPLSPSMRRRSVPSKLSRECEQITKAEDGMFSERSLCALALALLFLWCCFLQWQVNSLMHTGVLVENAFSD